MVEYVFSNPMRYQEPSFWPYLTDTFDPTLYLARLHANGSILDNFKPGTPVRFSGPLAVLDFLFTLPEEMNVFAVAAAGNDTTDPAKQFPPRFPAAVEGLLGVSASDASRKTASYSNSDAIQPDRYDGIMAFGGEAKAVAGGASSGSLTVTSSGPIGPFLATPFPAVVPVDPSTPATPGSMGSVTPPNTTGLATWAGTSFATPVAAGIAACIWSASSAEQFAAGYLSSPTDSLTAAGLLRAIVSPDGPHRDIELQQI